ncbi:MAG: amino acid adenylation domain-containing protein [Comamonadaceae bacterium]|nr:MAG: amino acid adenylation domain-containing protein [Comamonadaceae bacterium]
MELLSILKQLREREIRVSVEGSQLVLEGKTENIDPPLLQQLRDNKPALIELLSSDEVRASLPIEVIAQDRRYAPVEASFSQQRLWFLDRLSPNQSVYNLPDAVKMTGRLDVDALKRALNDLIARHESLRTVFVDDAGRPMQLVRRQLTIEVPLIDLTDLLPQSRDARVKELASLEEITGFDLEHGPLIRARLLRLTPTEHVLLFTLHHIVSDEWSMGVMLQEFAQLYGAWCEGQAPHLEPLVLQYPDYAQWERLQLSEANLRRQLGNWTEMLKDAPSLLSLPTDRPRPPVQRHVGAAVAFAVGSETLKALHAIATEANVTLFMVLHAAYAVLMSRWTGDDDICVGSPVANRPRPELEKLVGFFVNTIVIRTRVDQRQSFSQLLKRVRTQVLLALSSQNVPFEQIVELGRHTRDASYAPLVQTVLTFQNIPKKDFELPGVTMSSVSASNTMAKVDLSVNVAESEHGLGGVFKYNVDLFDECTVQALAHRFERLLVDIAANPESEAGAFDLLSVQERQQIVDRWNDTAIARKPDQGVREMFERVAEASPELIALVCEDQALSYAALDARANQLAHQLIAMGVTAETPVGIYLDRSIDMVVSILAVLKAGGAYVPLDPAQPADRLAYVAGDARLHLVITSAVLAADAPKAPWVQSPQAPLVLDELAQAIAAQPSHTPPVRALAQQLAYIIYTSGSTGQPKGVQLTHAGLGNLAQAQSQLFGVREGQRVLQFAAFSFDASTSEVFMALIVGGTLCLARRDQMMPGLSLEKTVARMGVQIATLPPVVLASMQPDALPSIHTIISAGEACSQVLAEQWGRGRRFINAYGPTEVTVCATACVVPQGLEQAPPIGRAIDNMQVYVLDARLQPQPVGVVGELYVAGQGLARGYRGKPALTAEKFVPNPFGEPGSRMYAAGDLVRWLADGEFGGQLEYLGRIDHQVKLRGFRIELGEIESALRALPDVQNAVVVVHEGASGDKRLVAYTVARQASEQPGWQEVRDALARSLPEYMVPAQMMWLDDLPLTPNGKVDLRALPVPEAIESEAQHVAPRTALEQTLCSIWADVLRLERVGINDDFFALGGHSLLATQLISRVETALNVEVQQIALFEAPSVAAFAERLGAGAKVREREQRRIPLADRSQPIPLSFAQQRLWFLDKFESDSVAYNVFEALAMRGPLDQIAIQHAVNRLVARHEVLRTVFAERDGQPVQQLVGPLELNVPLIDLRHLPDAEREQEARRLAQQEAETRFDLTRGPLMRVQLLRMLDNEHIVLFTVHHIVADGWSMGILLRELAAFYTAAISGVPDGLAPLPVQYADFSVWQRGWLTGDVLQEQVSHWENALAGAPALLTLPTDRPRPAVQTHCGSTFHFSLEQDIVDRLTALARETQSTLFIVLNAAFSVLLSRWSGQPDVCVGTPIANRTLTETEGLVGFFVNTLVLRTRVDAARPFIALLKEVRENTLAAYENQHLPFEHLVDVMNQDRSISYSPLFQVLLVLQNAPMQAFNVPGLELGGFGSEATTSKFDLSLYLVESHGHGLHAYFEYNTDLFDESTMERLSGSLRALLESICLNPQSRVADLELLPENQRRQATIEFNQTALDVCGALLPQRFEAQVQRTPDAVAAACDDETLTYRELNVRANRLAHHLRALGVGPEVRVGICMDRGLDLLAAHLAVLKSSGAYVPLDPLYPPERLEYMMDSARPHVVLTQSHQRQKGYPQATRILNLDQGWPGTGDGDGDGEGTADSDPAPLAQPHNLAYVLYTSGSTGRPKGVMLNHASLRNFMAWSLSEFDAASLAHVVFATSNCFDLSVFEMFAPLCSGGCVRVVPSILDLLAQPGKFAISLINTVPSAAAELLRQDALLPSLKAINLAGEALSAVLVLGLQERLPDTVVRNLYGPTEYTTYATFVALPSLASGRLPAGVPIGVPLANTQGYVLDPAGHPVPVGVTGELFLAGEGLARGYFGRPELTAERFVPNPFGRPGSLMYRSGDLARWRPDGQLDYHGRIDQQIKLHGFRIELGEIESVLNTEQAVEEAIVLAREDRPGQTRLVAYVVPAATDASGTTSAGIEQVEFWSETFDRIYGESTSQGTLDDAAPDTLQARDDFTGWVSSYDNQPIPREEMREWVEEIVARIAALAPERLIEVGCGTGLLLHRLAPICRHYHGTDLSAVVVEHLQQAVDQRADIRERVTLAQCQATESFAPTPDRAFDTVVVNSVAQYFPHGDYLTQVIESALNVLPEGGHVVLGDIRHAGLLEAFHSSVEAAHASGATPLWKLREAIDMGLRREDELLVDPAYFFALRQRLPRITQVQVLAKGRQAKNELTRFRYDVVLTVGGVEPDAGLSLNWQDWSSVAGEYGSEDRAALPQAEVLLQKLVAGPLALRDVPDAAFASTRALMRTIPAEKPESTLEALLGKLVGEQSGQQMPAFERIDFQALCTQAGLHIVVAPASGNKGNFHCVISRSPVQVDWSVLYPVGGGADALARHVSSPALSRSESTFQRALLEHLREALPEYMVPSHIMVLDRFPLNANGKVDRGALRAPDMPLASSSSKRSARTPTEEILAGIWCKLLDVQDVGLEDNFFSLGGHSLMATRVISRIRQTFNVDLSLRSVFESPTLLALAQHVDAMRNSAIGVHIPPVGSVPRDRPLPLSFAQQRLWFMDQFEPGSASYNMPTALRLGGALDTQALVAALDRIIARHEVLRTRFVLADGVAVQQIDEPTRFPLEVIDLSGQADPEAHVQQHIEEEARVPFDLATGPVIRGRMLTLADDDHVLLATMHHIVSDGWSMGVLIREFGALYQAFSRGRPDPLEPLAIQYADYAVWQRGWMTPDVIERQLAYWRENLQGAPEMLTLPTDRPRPPVQRHNGAAIRFAFPAELCQDLHALSRRAGSSLFMTLAAGFGVLLSRHAGQHDVCIGLPIANRHHAEIEPLIGFFVNTLTLRMRADPYLPFEDFLARVRSDAISAYAFQDLPFEQVVDVLNPARTTSHAPIYQVSFNMQNAPSGALELPGLNLEVIGAHNATVKLDMSVHLNEQDGQILGAVEFDTDLFDASTIQRLFEHYQVLLRSIADAPHTLVGELDMLLAAERKAVVSDWNAAAPADARSGAGLDVRMGDPLNVHGLFQRQVRRSGSAVALAFEDRQLSYGELDARANQLAHQLMAMGVTPETPVGIYLDRSIEMIVSILAVMKAAGAYVPLDPAQPTDRLAWIVDDAGLPLVITTAALAPRAPESMFQLVLDEQAQAIAAQSVDAPQVHVPAQQLAYIIYTSGSTGQPKGVQLTHDGLCSLAQAQAQLFGVREGQRVLQFAAFSFDASTWEIVMALTAGATLCLAPRDQLMPGLTLEKTIARMDVHVATLPPVVLASMQPDALPSVHTLVSAGEACSQVLAEAWGSGRRFFNAYGPTEVTVCASAYEVSDVLKHAPPIGRAIRNMQVYVLDARLQPQPMGVVGQLYVGGQGLARGYRGKPGLTAEKFVPNPFGEPGSRLYATGDLVRWLADGEFAGQLEYLGRIDHQVKIRGFRIELGEIESALRALPEVQNAVVTVREDVPGDKRLIAYVVGEQEADADQVQRWQDTFEQTYDDHAPDSGSFDIQGWISSYDHQPIPAQQMREWVEDTVSRIQSLQPQAALEIGCGSGLLLHPLARECTRYHGVDFAGAVLQQLDRSLDGRYPGCEITLQQAEASDASVLDHAPFDTVIVNSVAQYFPDEAYLLQVVENAVAAVGHQGSIFLGDIRHLGLLRVFHTSLERYGQDGQLRMPELASRVAARSARETELAATPSWFFALAGRIPGIASVEVLSKGGQAHNELTDYRYDVVIRVGQKMAPQAAQAQPAHTLHLWDGADIAGMEQVLGDHFAQPASAPMLVMRGIADAALAQDVAVFRALSSDQALSDVLAGANAGIERHALRQLCARLSLQVALAPADNDSGTFHAMFSRTASTQTPVQFDWASLYAAAGAGQVNEPALHSRHGLSAQGLQHRLRQHLPDYMVPQTIVMLDRFPVTVNGKVDLAALPVPDVEAGAAEYVAPRTQIEEIVCAIWAEVLRVERVGRTDNFFALGGHSLLAIQLIAKINAKFFIQLPVSNLFSESTPAEMSQSIAHCRIDQKLVVPLRREDAEENLFLVHPANGEVLAYTELAGALAGPLSVYGIRSHKAAGIEQPHSNLDQVCTAYADEIQAVQPLGSINLAGWSLGGLLAMRVAAMLEKQGRTVRGVTLLDTWLWDEEAAAAGQLPGEADGFTFRKFVEFVLDFTDDDPIILKQPELLGSLRNLKAAATEMGVEPLAEALESSSSMVRNSIGVTDEAYEDFIVFFRSTNSAYELTRNYSPQVIHAPIHTMWASETVASDVAIDCWLPYTKSLAESRSESLPGRHIDFVEGKNAAAVAQVLSDWIS